MKKILAALMALTLSISLGATIVNAASTDQTSQETLGTEFTFEYKNDPTYTVTIPSAVALEKSGTTMDITADNIANLENQRVQVTIAGTDKYRNQMLLEGKSEDGKNASIRYQFITEDGTVIETTGKKNEVVGIELASFTENGSVSLTVIPVLAASSATKKGVTYTGSMTYGIGLVDIE